MWKKALALFKVSWENGLVYRTSLGLWRLRQFLLVLMSLTVWTVIYQTGQPGFSYDQPQIIGYIFVVSFLQNLILSTILHGLAGTVYSGHLSNDLVKPANIFFQLAMRDIADKLKNVFFVVFEMGLLYAIFKPQIPIPDLSTISIFLVWVVLGTILYFLITLLFGAMGFWSPDIWGPKFIFFMLLDFTAGRLYPLDILPKVVQQIVAFTPFPYLSYVQTQLFLGRFDLDQVVTNSLAIVAWILILYLVNKVIWKQGFKHYTSTGH